MSELDKKMMTQVPIRFGAVLFDTNAPESGWASVEGKSAYRIQGVGDLDSDVRWWSSLTYQDFFGVSGLPQTILKRSDYLKTDMQQLMKELGLESRFVTPAESVEVLSEIFNRVMRLARDFYGIGGNGFAALTLWEELAPHLMGDDVSISSEMDNASARCYQSWVWCPQKRLKNADWISLRRPRLTHVLDILTTQVPSRTWDFVDAGKMGNNRIDWLMAQNRPALAMVAINKIQPEMAPVIGYGGGKAGERGWMALPEIEYMLKYANVRIEAAFISSGYEDIQPKRELQIGGEMGGTSISIGLLSECYLAAIYSPRFKKVMTRDGKPSEKLVSPRVAWLNAKERAISFNMSLPFHDEGFRVTGYGGGRISLAVPGGALNQAVDLASQHGLISPISANKDIMIKGALA